MSDRSELKELKKRAIKAALGVAEEAGWLRVWARELVEDLEDEDKAGLTEDLDMLEDQTNRLDAILGDTLAACREVLDIAIARRDKR